MYTFEDTKDTESVEVFTIDWSTWLSQISGDELSTSTWTVTSPSGDLDPVVVDESSITDNATPLAVYANATLSGGTLGNSYVLKNHVVTTNGREEDASVYFRTDSK